MAEFKERLRALRKENGLTVTQLAAKFYPKSKTEAAVRAWENGRSKPGSDDLATLADIFQVSTDYLLGRSNAKNEEGGRQLDIRNEKLAQILRDRYEGQDKFGFQSKRFYTDLLADFLEHNIYWLLEDFDSYICFDENEPNLFNMTVVEHGKSRKIPTKDLPTHYINSAKCQLEGIFRLSRKKWLKENKPPSSL